jgi:formate dehydrogenase subunit delta
MDIDNLVRMANQIGTFFSAYPDPEEAKSSIANHIQKFWEPRMRSLMLDCMANGQTPELMPLVHESLTLHAATLRPKAPAPSA